MEIFPPVSTNKALSLCHRKSHILSSDCTYNQKRKEGVEIGLLAFGQHRPTLRRYKSFKITILIWHSTVGLKHLLWSPQQSSWLTRCLGFYSDVWWLKLSLCKAGAFTYYKKRRAAVSSGSVGKKRWILYTTLEKKRKKEEVGVS